jgi:glutamate synthase (NADPH/NADH) small chain
MAKILPRTQMAKREAEDRIRDFNEVALGLTEEEAIYEANRCLQCPNQPCIAACPVGSLIPQFIKAVKEKDFVRAYDVVREKNRIPAISGRVCPQETLCEEACTLARVGQPVAIGAVERFIADYALKNGISKEVRPGEEGHRKVAVVGSGPAGLTVAAEMVAKGHEVKVFEALHKPGGVVVYGIPEFRLPKKIVQQEVDLLKRQGVQFEHGVIVGRTIKVKDLFDDGYNSVFVGTGAGTPKFMGLPGENYNYIYSSNEFLTRINLLKAYSFPTYGTPVKVGKKVVVIGAGNTAMDSSRTALRMGADEVYVVYRRTRAEMPARKEEVFNAEEEGVQFMLLSAPVRFLGDEKGSVRSVELQAMELGEPDASGRRRPKPLPGSEFIKDADTVVIAIGNKVNPLIQMTTPGLRTEGDEGLIKVDETYESSIKGLFAAGDVVLGEATVIQAMGTGQKAAYSMDRKMKAI